MAKATTRANVAASATHPGLPGNRNGSAPTTEDVVNLATAARLEQKATPGYLTTEFYFAALSALLAFAFALLGRISFEVATGAITAAGVAYSVARGIAKT